MISRVFCVISGHLRSAQVACRGQKFGQKFSPELRTRTPTRPGCDAAHLDPDVASFVRTPYRSRAARSGGSVCLSRLFAPSALALALRCRPLRGRRQAHSCFTFASSDSSTTRARSKFLADDECRDRLRPLFGTRRRGVGIHSIVFGHGVRAFTPARYAHLLHARGRRRGYVVAAPVFPLGNAGCAGRAERVRHHQSTAGHEFCHFQLLALSALVHGVLYGKPSMRLTSQSLGIRTARRPRSRSPPRPSVS